MSFIKPLKWSLRPLAPPCNTLSFFWRGADGMNSLTIAYCWKPEYRQSLFGPFGVRLHIYTEEREHLTFENLLFTASLFRRNLALWIYAFEIHWERKIIPLSPKWGREELWLEVVKAHTFYTKKDNTYIPPHSLFRKNFWLRIWMEVKAEPYWLWGPGLVPHSWFLPLAGG